MESRALVSEAVCTGGEFTEVPGGLGDYIVKEFEDDTASGSAIEGDVKLDVEGCKCRVATQRKGRFISKKILSIHPHICR